MSGVGGIGGAVGVDRVLALRAQILERNQALQRANASANAAPAPGGPVQTPTTGAPSFADTLNQALQGVNATQNRAGQVSEAYERGEEIDIAKVMLARQEASVSFEATLQVRNKLLSAYRDIMSMPV
ncbi:MAG: flagellar hook-basal body complex protein FliE [Sphingomonas sp.]|jgi:flagellar hook-basal body complex protein FliE